MLKEYEVLIEELCNLYDAPIESVLDNLEYILDYINIEINDSNYKYYISAYFIVHRHLKIEKVRIQKLSKRILIKAYKEMKEEMAKIKPKKEDFPKVVNLFKGKLKN